MRQHPSASRLRTDARYGSQGLTPQVLLGVHPFFSMLMPGDVSELLARAHSRDIAADQTIFRKDDPGDGLYGVLAGQVAFTIDSRSGKELTLNVLGPGEFFGEIALLDGGGARQPRERAVPAGFFSFPVGYSCPSLPTGPRR